MKFNLPDSTKNWTSIIGATIASITLFMIIFLFAISVLFNQGGSYLGLVIYIILPAFLIAGLILIPIGMVRKRTVLEKEKKSSDYKPLPFIDLNNSKHRNAAFVFVVGTVLFLFVSALGSYQAFHFSESVEFCGKTCHNIMIPEYTAYQNSPHARVKCAECHVGEGADWYMRSKLSGLRQVYKTIIDDVPKPISTPIHNLRPARDICEKCHWPQKFYSRSIRMERHYLRDEENSEWDINLEMKVGPKFSAKGLEEGIHWHINPNVSIEYISTDEKRQSIPWVKYINLESGEEIIFESEENNVEADDLKSFEIRVVDCIDCHNRPSHKFNAPEFFINNAITAGEISKELPEIKSIAVEVCIEEYSSTDSALVEIEKRILEFYEENYPEIIEEKSEILDSSISQLQKSFSQNIFPEMSVRWDKYPINIGHIKSNGCFRCHDDEHVSEDGKVISRDCNICHLINSQGPPENMVKTSIGEGLEFMHPGGYVEKEDWEESLCSECHEGNGP
ncbi:MAG: NapC/NirT family cytochrome c [Melioribacteraceae bacterium]|jgi:formate-dependent nitrite reductase cytochrome c552 subunit|nr:NapC/NirT family cytochrome c [Melioribacteraceae bacterium]